MDLISAMEGGLQNHKHNQENNTERNKKKTKKASAGAVGGLTHLNVTAATAGGAVSVVYQLVMILTMFW